MKKDTNDSVVEQNNDTKPAEKENLVNQTADKGVESPDNVPYARFNEIVKQNNEYKSKLDSLLKEQDAQRTKRMEEQGKYKELNAELQSKVDSLQEKNAYYVELENKERENLLSKIPEDDRQIYEDLSTEKLRKHISNMEVRQSVPTDKSKAVRGNVLPDDKDIWSMSPEEKKKNWTAYLNKFKK
tara:strand:- start:1533 stop:2087 length:555 start_codon:yes stop_codon:yes gene_type:complete